MQIFFISFVKDIASLCCMQNQMWAFLLSKHYILFIANNGRLTAEYLTPYTKQMVW